MYICEYRANLSYIVMAHTIFITLAIIHHIHTYKRTSRTSYCIYGEYFMTNFLCTNILLCFITMTEQCYHILFLYPSIISSQFLISVSHLSTQFFSLCMSSGNCSLFTNIYIKITSKICLCFINIYCRKILYNVVSRDVKHSVAIFRECT